jgi:protein O-GlcNAc transferase
MNNQQLEEATVKHRAGDLSGARRLYRLVLEDSRANPVASFRLGLLELQDRHPDAALPLISAAVAATPSDVRYQFGLGETLSALGRWEDAADAYRRVIAINPDSPESHYALGIALACLADHTGAIAAYQAAVALQPDYADAFNNLGNAHRMLGQMPEAAAAYERAIALRPDYAGAMSNLGTLLNGQAKTTEAMQWLGKAVHLEPLVSAHAVNLAAALCDQRRFADAVPLLRSVLSAEPTHAQAANNLANALQGLGQLREAEAQFEKAISLQPDYADAMNNLGNLCRQLGEFSRAMDWYESAIRASRSFAVAMNNAGCVLRTLGRLDEAEAMLRRALAVDPRLAGLHDNLGNVLKDSGQVEQAIACYRRAIVLDPRAWGTHGNLAYSLSFASSDGRAILEECLRWKQQHTADLQTEIRAHANDRTPDRRLRVGYVSPDFREHCQSLFVMPVLSNHDHESFEIFCYSSVERPDRYTKQIAEYADVWREVAALDDASLAKLIREDRIDILVDLTMHMAGGRPLVFARKPAPVQIAWLAYPGTTGMSAIDYRLSDARLDPPGYETFYSERTIHLPDSFWCYHPLTDRPAVNQLPAIQSGQINFGCLNNPCKLTDDTLRLWAAVMRALPASTLTVMNPPGAYRQRFLQRFSQHGVDGSRVEFVAYRPRADYLESYHRIDIGLDTFPYNGHTTSLDSFWMGVPVVTRVGQTCVGRGGLSQLFQLDLLELAAGSDEKFITAALGLASDLDRLATLRQQLRPRLRASALMDGRRFTHNLESIFRQTWLDYAAKP